MCFCDKTLNNKCEASFDIRLMYDYYDGITEGIVQCKECKRLYYCRVASIDFYPECIRLFYFTEVPDICEDIGQESILKYQTLPVTHIAVASSSLKHFYLWKEQEKK